MPLACKYIFIYILSIVIKILNVMLTITKTFHIQATTRLNLKMVFPFILSPDFCPLGDHFTHLVSMTAVFKFAFGVSFSFLTTLFSCYHHALL